MGIGSSVGCWGPAGPSLAARAGSWLSVSHLALLPPTAPQPSVRRRGRLLGNWGGHVGSVGEVQGCRARFGGVRAMDGLASAAAHHRVESQ